MTKSHTFPTFTLHNSHEPNSKPLESLTAAECERLTEWSDKDKILYRTPDIKLKSIIEREYRDWETDRKSTRLNSSHSAKSRMPSSA